MEKQITAGMIEEWLKRQSHGEIPTDLFGATCYEVGWLRGALSSALSSQTLRDIYTQEILEAQKQKLELWERRVVRAVASHDASFAFQIIP